VLFQFHRTSQKDKAATAIKILNVFYIAVGSLAELDTQIEIAKRLKYINAEDANRQDSLALEIRLMLFGIIISLPE
jgi:four helix bundle protein